MSWANPPAVVAALGDALLECSAWLSLFADADIAAAAMHYPEAGSDEVGPLAVLSVDGTAFRIVIAANLDAGALQGAAHEIAFQLQSRYRPSGTGLLIVAAPEVGEVGEPTGSMAAAGNSMSAVELSGRWGLTD